MFDQVNVENIILHTHTHTHIYIYIYIYINTVITKHQIVIVKYDGKLHCSAYYIIKHFNTTIKNC